MYAYISICIVSEYGDLRISGGGSSGRLEIQNKAGRWGTICIRGFDDDAGDVACSQLGYDESSHVYTDKYVAGNIKYLQSIIYLTVFGTQNQ